MVGGSFERAEPSMPCPSPSNMAPGHKEKEKSEAGPARESWWAGLCPFNELQC